jgi:hypothetical protein
LKGTFGIHGQERAKGALSYATQLLSTNQPIPAPRWLERLDPCLRMQVDGVDQCSIHIKQDGFGHRVSFLLSLVSTELLPDFLQKVAVGHSRLPTVE